MGKPGGGRGKKKNAGVGVDFKRAKHRVGKKLPRAQNATDTSFKSRTLSLAEQSVAADKEGQAVTGRNLTLKDVLGQCGHYSERVRRDALQGLAELLAAHPAELRRHTTLVVETAAERIGDGDASVRAALRELLAGTLLPVLGGSALAPFVPLLMAHVCAAMTHLAEPIRADALGFLELLMGARPDLVAAGGSLAPVLHHFGDLLSKGSRGRSIKAGSLASLHGVVLSLERFLARAVAALEGAAAGGSSSSGAGGGAAAPAAGGGAEAQQQHQQPVVLMWRRCGWPPAGAAASQHLAAAAAEGSGGPAAAAGDGGAAAAATPAAGAEMAAAAELLGHLLDCWSEAGPSQLAETPELIGAQCLTAILRSCDLLLGRWGTASLAGSTTDRASLAATLLKRVAPYFPVQRPTVTLAPALADQLVQLNVAGAQLLARFLPGQQQQAAFAAAAGAGYGSSIGGGGGGEEPWVERLLDWFVGVMADGSALPEAEDGQQLFAQASTAAEPTPAAAAGEPAVAAKPGGKRRRSGGASGGAAAAAAVQGLPAEVYQSALDGSLRVLPLLPPPPRQQLLAAAWRLWQRSSVRSGAKPRVLAFWQALLADPAAAFYAPTPGGGPLLQQAEVATWLAALPRFLFELSSSSPAVTLAALQLLLGAARSAPPGGSLAAALQGLQPQLAPLFAVLLPPVGGQQAAAEGARVHVGPLAGLPTAVQDLAVDLLYHFPAASEQLLRAAAVVCLGDAYPASTALRLLDVLSAKAGSGAADAAAFAGLLLNLLSGASQAGLHQRSWARHEALVGAACRAALGLGEPAAVAAALLPPLLGAAAGGSRWAAYGLLQLSVAVAAAVAGAEQEWQLEEALAAALPRLMLQLHVSCQQQQAAAAQDDLGSQQATALCLRLLALQARQLLPLLLTAVSSSLAAGPDAGAASGSSSLLPAALHLLLAMLREQALLEPLLDQQAAVQAALAACRAAAEAAGSAMQSGRDCREQLRQLEALCAAVLGL